MLVHNSRIKRPRKPNIVLKAGYFACNTQPTFLRAKRQRPRSQGQQTAVRLLMLLGLINHYGATTPISAVPPLSLCSTLRLLPAHFSPSVVLSISPRLDPSSSHVPSSCFPSPLMLRQLLIPTVYKTCSFTSYWLWSPYVIGQTIIFLPCDFYLSFFLSSSFFFFLA